MPDPDRFADNSNGSPEDDAPQVVRSGGRFYTLNALREMVEAQFDAELAGRDDILREADTRAKRRALVLDCANYVLAVESIFLSRTDKERVIEAAYANLFGFGPLEPFLGDEALTEITIDGPDNAHARRGSGKMEHLPIAFDDTAHLRCTIDRLLATQGAALSDWNYFIEIGVELHGRPARLGLVTPPISPQLQVALRLHPRTPLTLDDLIAGGMLTGAAARALTDHIAAGRGLLVIGDVGSGKTTLLNALGPFFAGRVVAVQRAAELRLPESASMRAAVPPADDNPGADFGAQIEAALAEPEPPDWLLLDEVRDDAAKAAWNALNAAEGDAAPRCAWAFRGDPAPDRVRNALSMLLRRARPAAAQRDINTLVAARLPLVAALAIVDGAPRVTGVGAFALDAQGELTVQQIAKG